MDERIAAQLHSQLKNLQWNCEYYYKQQLQLHELGEKLTVHAGVRFLLETYPDADVMLTTNNFTIVFTATSIKDTATEILTALEDQGIPIESWESSDYPEDLRRVYYCDTPEGFTLSISIAATVDGACRQVVVGTVMRSRFVEVPVPVFQLICD